MSNTLCRCATECEWLPEHYSLAHHPECAVNALSSQTRMVGASDGQTLVHVVFGEPVCRYNRQVHSYPPPTVMLDGEYLHPNAELQLAADEILRSLR